MSNKIKSAKFKLGSWAFMILMITAPHVVNAQDISGSGRSSTEKNFRAGSATANITPPLGLGIVGGWGTPPATHIHDELHARCIALDDGSTKLVFIVVDNVGLNYHLINEAKDLIQQQTNIPREHVLISSTHTHSSVSAGGVGEKRRQLPSDQPFDEYQQFLIGRISDVARIAINNLEPAKIGWGVGSVPEHVFIRRWSMKPGTPIPNPFGGQDKVMMNPGRNPNLLEPAGKTDPEVSFISIKSRDGKPIALLANYSLHYVGGVPIGDISADYFSIFNERMKELLDANGRGSSFVGIMTNGTSGDVNNINVADANSENPAKGKEAYVQMQIVADDVAEEVFRVYNTIKYLDWVPLRAAEEQLRLQVRKPSSEMLERAQMVIARPDTVELIHRHEITYANRIIHLNENWPDNISVTLQAFGIGDLGIATIPFEVFAEIGIEIKERSPFKTSFTIGLANGNYGYLPTPQQHLLGGYETWMGTNKVEFDASVKIVSTLMDMFSKIE